MPLHTKPDGNLIHPQTLSQAFERTVATTTLPPISLHDLRHTHATLLLNAGVPPQSRVRTTRTSCQWSLAVVGRVLLQ